MAFILKSSKLIFTFFRIARDTKFMKVQYGVTNSFERKFLHVNNMHSYRKFSTASANVMTADMLEKSIHQLDLDARYKQRINLRDVEEILAALKHWSTINYHHSLLLLRCCGSTFLNIQPYERTNLVHEAMLLIEKLGVQLDIIHYNTLLAAYLENEHKFSPSEFLEKLQEKNLKPNKITFQRLLKAYCQQGDIAGASNLLEKMKNDEISINEDIFNSLIHGHCQVNDLVSAASIVDLMQAKGIEPSSETYLNLLCGYAKAGKITEIRKIMSDCESKDIIFLDKDILEIVYTLAINNHFEYIDEILDKVKKQFGYHSQARLCVLRLLQKNLDAVALKVYKTTIRSDVVDEKRNSVKYIIEYYVKYRTPEQILEFCQKMQKEGLISTSFALTLKEILNLDEHSKALQLFSIMRKNNLPLRPHYFWPIILKASHQGNKSILDILMKMKKLGVSRCFYTCTKIVCPNYVFGNDWLDDIEKLHEAGADKIYIGRKLFTTFLMDGKLENAEKLAATVPLVLKSNFYLNPMLDCLLRTKNVDFFVNVIYYFLHDIHQESFETSETDSSSDSDTDEINESNCYAGHNFIENIIEKLTNNCEEDLLILVLQKMLDKKIRISHELSELVQKKFNSAEVKTLLNKLMDENLHVEFDQDILNLKKRSSYHQENEGSNTFSGKVSEMIELVKNNNAKKAVELCCELVNMFPDRNFTTKETKKFKVLLMALAHTGDYEGVQKAYETGIRINVIGSRHFYPLVVALTVRGELEKATDLFCQMVFETKCKSAWPSFVTKLIEVQNAELLQKVTNIMTKIEDEAFSIAMLLSQFAKLGKIKEIKKLLDSKGFLLPKKSVDIACWWLFKNNSIEGFESFLAATKNLSYVNRINIYNFLLKLYIAEGDSKKAKGLWLNLEEENIPPSQKFLNELGEFLKKIGEPLPFSLDQTKGNLGVKEDNCSNSMKPD